MWIYNNQIITAPKSMIIDDVQYPEVIFYLWSKSELLKIGIKKYNPAVFQEGDSISSVVIKEIDDEIYEIIEKENNPPIINSILEDENIAPTENFLSFEATGINPTGFSLYLSQIIPSGETGYFLHTQVMP